VMPLLDGTRRRTMRRRWIVGGVTAAALLAAGLFAGQDWGDRLTNIVVLTPKTDLTSSASMSFDGKWVAYASDRSESGRLTMWIQPSSGGGARRVSSLPADDEAPTLSPNGQLVAFSS